MNEKLFKFMLIESGRKTYDEIEPKDPKTLYIITETGEVFFKEKLLSNSNLEIVSELPSIDLAKKNKVYIVRDANNLGIFVFDGLEFISIINNDEELINKTIDANENIILNLDYENFKESFIKKSNEILSLEVSSDEKLLSEKAILKILEEKSNIKEFKSDKSLNIESNEENIYFKVKISKSENNNISLNEDGLFNSNYSIDKQELLDSEEYTIKYIFKKDENILQEVFIPRNIKINNITIKECEIKNTPLYKLEVGDKYIDFLLNDSGSNLQDKHFYLSCKEMETNYVNGNGISISEDKIISLKLNPENQNGITLNEKGLGINLARKDNYKLATEFVQGQSYYKFENNSYVLDSTIINKEIFDNLEYNVYLKIYGNNGSMSKEDKENIDLLLSHSINKENPHEVTKVQIGLENVDNTSDVNKPISNLTKEALDTKVDKVEGKGLSTNDFTNELKESYDNHLLNKENPHEVTKEQLNLGSVDNTSDLDKPISNLVKEALDNKVDKEEGKTLSSNDFTNDLKEKVINNDTLLQSHTTNEEIHVTSLNKESWNSMYEQSNYYTDEKINQLINGSPETLDTLKELADAIEQSSDIVEALNGAIGTKANADEVNSHVNNSNIHVTPSEKQKWNNVDNKLDTDGNSSDTTVTFTESTSKENLNSGENLSTVFGKIFKYFKELGTFAFKSSIEETDLPTGTVIDNNYYHTDENYTTLEKEKLSNIENNAQVNNVTGVKGDNETEYREGNINITKENIGLSEVDNKSSSTIISEITKEQLDEKLNIEYYTEDDINNAIQQILSSTSEVS